ncbi:nitroimidazol reductase NimA-like FMN-containing flavoprotein (pyridoxamine 5'-phosphate oxidase superfamily) [Dysgonomonas sp. PH5-45]|uniref:pyridoxamine 5'-phosphate oxidase family protein n=1 Tax=unclassified Dysgonomonas TaxID=2630389 RepID=UPI002472F60A|nr:MULTISPECIES: pyridoxamine 5'-phosphate oxidase family protein [unclassified Dysgonomonas]MDH6354854.1 nitroimidazol reductase NimA-like FMN-containing flavoprotein (pyridoxamine 5'-phosphate oxidase superfamily) [Dysgonomonas sp. PH5-45]MDH6387753.1 nitroimidazol reductase NimA-like FMN-containing flavoprotein (pyridoxamine 5'-phosphate oxidase superfamily) [Dysgonomonas sp. PH5-37]
MVTIAIEEKQIIEKIIRSAQTCHVAMIDTEGLPYVIPMNFGYEEEIIYLHSAPEGSSIEALEKNPEVCIVFCTDAVLRYQHQDVACSYGIKGSSVMCRGKVTFEENLDEKAKALNIIMRQYSDRQFKYSEPALRNVKVWKVEVASMTSKRFGAPNPNSRNYKDSEEF